ncbi:AAA family ATPase [Saccharibacillus sp. CPCC 101409]|uniref:AAA family ATPase n=1 Tax=Saccharibacillus sp. CPCC 101409 TaxID=3058041 RepID=UPI002670FEF5|nr:AAA family ATPase [Saccharibacillus sp. CPCC 101409]MDO3409939.1 AAA family ATPase [Saccharibacillus sp. CPCC 101409]
MKVEQLGPIKKLEIHLGQETILIGKNNSGKTYVSYLLYGIFKKIDSLKNEILFDYFSNLYSEESGLKMKVKKDHITNYFIEETLKRINKSIHEDLPHLFNLPRSEFKNTKIEIERSDLDFFEQNSNNRVATDMEGQYAKSGLKENLKVSVYISTAKNQEWSIEIKDASSIIPHLSQDEHIWALEGWDLESPIVKDYLLRICASVFSYRLFPSSNVLYVPAERNGINVFRNELMTIRSSETFDVENVKKPLATYPMPIADYMKYLTLLDINHEEKFPDPDPNHDRKDTWTEFSKNILRGKYEYDENQNEYYYRELYSFGADSSPRYRKHKIPLKAASSSAKSLFGLEYYLKYRFSFGDILFVDEPEMNLDPENQINMAGILAKLAKLGVKVVISTHSDYVVRSTTNILLADKLETFRSEESPVVTLGYSFDKDGMKPLGDLSKADYIASFDNANAALEDHYLSLIEQLEEKETRQQL